MSIHISVKRPTKLKTANVNNDNRLQDLANIYKCLENNGKELAKISRKIKVDIKKLDKLHIDNAKKREKNKPTVKNSEKEYKLIKKIDLDAGLVTLLYTKLNEEFRKHFSSVNILKEFKWKLDEFTKKNHGQEQC